MQKSIRNVELFSCLYCENKNITFHKLEIWIKHLCTFNTHIFSGNLKNNEVAVFFAAIYHATDRSIRSIKLPQLSTKIEDNVAATVSGWGYQSSGDHLLSSELKYAIVYTVNQQKCHESLYSHGGITNAMFCAAARTINGILVGVVSWGVGCADPYYLGVYTRLAYAPIRFWIKLLTKL